MFFLKQYSKYDSKKCFRCKNKHRSQAPEEALLTSELDGVCLPHEIKKDELNHSIISCFDGTRSGEYGIYTLFPPNDSRLTIINCLNFHLIKWPDVCWGQKCGNKQILLKPCSIQRYS